MAHRLRQFQLPLPRTAVDQLSFTHPIIIMFKILTLIILGYFAYKLFLGPETTIKIERNVKKKPVDREKEDDGFVDYEELD